MIKVGDKVTWRHGISNKKAASRVYPIGIANCEVLEFGETAEGRAAAKIKLPPGLPMATLNVLVDDLEETQE